MKKFNDGLDMSGEGDRGVRDSFKVSDLYTSMLFMERGSAKKGQIEDDRFLF